MTTSQAFGSISERIFASNLFQKDHVGKRMVLQTLHGISVKSSLKANAILSITVNCHMTSTKALTERY